MGQPSAEQWPKLDPASVNQWHPHGQLFILKSVINLFIDVYTGLLLQQNDSIKLNDPNDWSYLTHLISLGHKKRTRFSYNRQGGILQISVQHSRARIKFIKNSLMNLPFMMKFRRTTKKKKNLIQQ